LIDSDLAWVGKMVRALNKADAMLTLSSPLISGAIYHFLDLQFTDNTPVKNKKQLTTVAE